MNPPESSASDAQDPSPPGKGLELQGPRPSPLKVHKSIYKTVLINTTLSEFRETVQRLTGSSFSSDHFTGARDVSLATGLGSTENASLGSERQRIISEDMMDMEGTECDENYFKTSPSTMQLEGHDYWRMNEEMVLDRTHVRTLYDDGYRWRKYGKKSAYGDKFPISYYKCTGKHCGAKKKVQRSDEDNPTFEITYKGKHTCMQGSNSNLLVSSSSNPTDDISLGSIDNTSTLPSVGDVPTKSETFTSIRDIVSTASGADRQEMVQPPLDPDVMDVLSMPEGADAETSSEIEDVEMLTENEEFEMVLQPWKGRLFLMRGGLGLTEPPKIEEWENAKEIHLMDNKLFELPENPKCPILSSLFLQRNYKLRKIPATFFKHMPTLQVLNLSRTRIKSLPESLFKLINLQRLFINNCDLLTQISPKVGELKHLEVLDLEGTEIMDLPKEVKNLVNLKCLEVSFYGFVSHGRRFEQSNTLIPCGIISSLSNLEELRIDVNPDDENWDLCVEAVLGEVCSLTKLSAIKFYFPRVELLGNCFWFNDPMISPSLPEFRFIVGHHAQRIMTRLPCDVEFELERWDRCLKYVNGVGIPVELRKVLQQSTAFFLDRHTTIKKLSSFGIGNMRQLNCCVLGECNELRVIVDGEDIYEGVNELVALESLEYLYIFRMKNLRNIWEGPVPIQGKCLGLLKFLTLRTCPQMSSIFAEGLLDNFNNLEELVVEDCSAIRSLVICPSIEKQKDSRRFLPRLKKISLDCLPELVSISTGLSIAPKLEWMSVYGCPNLKTLPIEDMSENYLKKIKGERNWWEALEWRIKRPDYLDDIFVPINL